MTPSPSVATIVAGNRRLSGQLRRHHELAMRASGTRVWESPSILPFEAWTRRLWSDLSAREPFKTPILLSQIQEETLWRQAIEAHHDATELLDITATAAAAARAWDLLHAWKLPLDRQIFSEATESAAFLEWAVFVQNQLREHGWITSSQLAGALIERGALANTGPVEYAGFFEMTPRERDSLAACRASEHVPAQAPGPIEPLLYRATLPDENAEWERAALWAREKLEAQKERKDGEDREASTRVGIVIPGLSQRRTQVERIFDDILNPNLNFAPQETAPIFHLSSGMRASEHPLVATALLVLGLEQGLALSDVGALLRSPYLNLDATGGARLDAQLRRRRTATVYFEDLRTHLPQWRRHGTEDLLSQSRRPSEWSAIFSSLVMASGWPGERTPTRKERRTVEDWKDLLSGLASLDDLLPGLSFNAALDHLRRIANQARLHDEASDEADAAPVQLLDLDEAAGALPGLKFDALWITGMHAAAWPAPARPNPFLPLEMQRAAGVARSTPELELARARTVTNLLLASAPEVVCSYPAALGEEEASFSSLIQRYFDRGAFRTLDTTLRPETMLECIARSAPLLELGHAEAPALPPGAETGGGARLLEDQAACPFRAFAVYRLGARELDELEIGVSPRERGGAVHSALEWIWNELKTRGALLALSPGEVLALAEASAVHALKDSRAPERFRRLEHRRLVKLLLRWLEHEKQRPPFTVVEKEADRKAELGGLILKIRPDRVDRYEDGTHAVIDYKTSKLLKVKDWDGERPAAPQLPLYAIQSENEISEVMFVKLTAPKVEALSRSGAELAQSLPQWKRALETLAENFVAGSAAVDPHKGRKTCEYCALPGLCRVSELGFPEEEDAEAADE